MTLKRLWKHEPFRVLVCCFLALGGGFLLSIGKVSGTASPLAVAIAGICTPLYSFAILSGALLAYIAEGAPEEMRFLVAALIGVVCIRALFRDRLKPSILAIITACGGIAGGFFVDCFLNTRKGMIPLYIVEALLTGIAAYFLADAWNHLKKQKRISFNAGKSFAFSLSYMLAITALCGLDTAFCNLGRIIGIALTMLCAKQLHQQGGTLCGALTACGVVLCGVQLGMPLLFLPVTGMLAGFVSSFPNAFYIPTFFLMQLLSCAMLGNHTDIVKIIIELILACTLYALYCHVDIYILIAPEEVRTSDRLARSRQERFLSNAMQELHDETSEVMHRLNIQKPEDAVSQMRNQVCTGCCQDCWKPENARKTEICFRMLLHESQNTFYCLRKERLFSAASEITRKTALAQMQRVHMLQNRSVTLECLQLMEMLTTDTAARRERTCSEPETAALQNILHTCACDEASCFVYQLRSGRYCAEIYSKQENFPIATIQELLSRRLNVPLNFMKCEQKKCFRYCFSEVAPYYMEYAYKSINAPEYERCGDHADAFTDSAGNQYLVLSDGMGSGSMASLASRIAVRTFRKMVTSGMPPETAVKLVNMMLLTETSTENFATLDILFLNVDTGIITVSKSGAAATLFYSNGQMQRISSQSFPVGIVPDAMPSSRHVTTNEGDAIVMVSDGIGEAEFPYIRQLLQQDLPLTEIVDSVCEKSAVFLGGNQRDDMTVIVARIVCETDDKNCQSLTNLMPETSRTMTSFPKIL